MEETLQESSQPTMDSQSTVAVLVATYLVEEDCGGLAEAAGDSMHMDWQVVDEYNLEAQLVHDEGCGIGILAAPFAHGLEWIHFHHDDLHRANDNADAETTTDVSATAASRNRAESDLESSSSTTSNGSSSHRSGETGCYAAAATLFSVQAAGMAAAAAPARGGTTPGGLDWLAASDPVGDTEDLHRSIVSFNDGSDELGHPMEDDWTEDDNVAYSSSSTSSSMLRPTPDELAHATTDRKRRALDTWYQRVHELVEYRDAHQGSCHVPQRIVPLGTWCNKQREEYKAYRRRHTNGEEGGTGTSMTPRRIAVLEHVGFQWAKPKGEASWKSHYDELKLIKKHHGTIRVPLRVGAGRNGAAEGSEVDFGTEVKALGRWITEQRKQKGLLDAGKPSRLTPERVRMLTELGFDWGQPRSLRPISGSVNSSSNNNNNSNNNSKSRQCRRALLRRSCRRRGGGETPPPSPVKRG